MGILNDIEEHFSVNNLYDLFNLKKNAKNSEIKKSYRHLSLKHHPDKFQDCEKVIIDKQTLKFQLLTKCYSVLTDEEKRKVYDEQNIILDDDDLNDAMCCQEFWRKVFPKITEDDINNFYKKYIGSEEEKEDLKKAYIKHKGDMNLLYEYVIGFDEDYTRKMINELIENKELDPYPKFVNESRSSIEKRKKRIQNEQKRFDKQKKDDDDDLLKAIAKNMANRKVSFDSMLANLEAKYDNSNKKQKTKKK